MCTTLSPLSALASARIFGEHRLGRYARSACVGVCERAGARRLPWTMLVFGSAGSYNA
jgi:hypothetical protein